jgi:pimeloyl-ACP methyl ester carboxylesterase
MGTRLFKNGGSFWDPDKPTSMVPLLWASAGTRAEMLSIASPVTIANTGVPKAGLTPDQITRGWAGPVWGFYGLVLNFLDTQNWGGNSCRVYAFGYDWRQSNQVSGRQLITYINWVLSQETDAKKVVLVTHSMGGLVSRWALKNGAAGQVKGVIHAVQPAVGAVVAYRRYKSGAIYSDPYNDEPFPLTRILGRSPYDYAVVSYGLRGPQELLPSNSHPASPYQPSHWLTWDRQIPVSITAPPGNIYDVYRESTGFLGLFASSDPSEAAHLAGIITAINGAEAFHAGMGTWAHTSTFVVAINGNGTDVGTDISYVSASGTEVNETLLKLSKDTYMQGDGTVPFGSQTALPVPQANQAVFQASNGDPSHADAFTYRPILDKVKDFVNRIVNLP